jgi:hypothetical protein
MGLFCFRFSHASFDVILSFSIRGHQVAFNPLTLAANFRRNMILVTVLCTEYYVLCCAGQLKWCMAALRGYSVPFVLNGLQ